MAKPPKPPRVKESEVQRAIVQALELAGFHVLVNSRIQATKGGDIGDADLSVRHRLCRRGLALMLEVKRPGPIRFTSSQQKDLRDEGFTVVVQSPEEALKEAYEWLLEQSHLAGPAVFDRWEPALGKAWRTWRSFNESLGRKP